MTHEITKPYVIWTLAWVSAQPLLPRRFTAPRGYVFVISSISYANRTGVANTLRVHSAAIEEDREGSENSVISSFATDIAGSNFYDNVGDIETKYISITRRVTGANPACELSIKVRLKKASRGTLIWEYIRKKM